MAMLGLIGGPLIFLSGMAIVLGAYDNGSTANSLLSIPEIAWTDCEPWPPPRTSSGDHRGAARTWGP
jgi:hypothetical protein